MNFCIQLCISVVIYCSSALGPGTFAERQVPPSTILLNLCYNETIKPPGGGYGGFNMIEHNHPQSKQVINDLIDAINQYIGITIKKDEGIH